MEYYFLHGLDSSSKGTKALWLKNRYPFFTIPDFSGTLEQRLQKLETLCRHGKDIFLVGSSFGGLMATCFAAKNGSRISKLVLMAPALNFPGFMVPKPPITAPAYLLIGSRDTITPPEKVLPLAQQSFAHLQIDIADEDHLLHGAFADLDWDALLRPEATL